MQFVAPQHPAPGAAGWTKGWWRDVDSSIKLEVLRLNRELILAILATPVFGLHAIILA